MDLSFDAGSGVNGQIYAITVQPAGKAIIGGAYMPRVRGVGCQNIARLHADGSGDPSYDAGRLTGFNYIRALTLQAGGKVLVGFNGGVSRLNPDGTADASFIPPGVAAYGGSSSGVGSVAIQPDGKILIGGQSMTGGQRLDRPAQFRREPRCQFQCRDRRSRVGNRTATGREGAHRRSTRDRQRRRPRGIARLEADGAVDAEFVPGVGSSGLAQAFAVQADGRIVVDRYLSAPQLIRLHADGMILAGGVNDGQPVTSALMRIETGGTRDEAFVVGGGVGLIDSVTPQPDGKVLLGGAIGPRADGSIARLNRDGSWDETFYPAPGAAVDGERILLQPHGRMLLSGRSTNVDEEGTVTGRGEITRLHVDGSLDETFHAGHGVPGGFHLMALQPDGRVLACGETTVDEVSYKTLARLHADGSVDWAFQALHLEAAGLPDVNCVAVSEDGRILVGGRFYLGGDPNSYSLVRLNADGTPDGSFHEAYDAEGNGLEVRSIITAADGKILIAGIVSGADGVVGETVRRLHGDGTVDESFDPGQGVSVYTATTDGGGIAWQPDGKVIASGFYHSGTGESYNGPVRLNADGSLDRTFRVETAYFPGNHCLALQSDGDVVVGGGFLTIRGVFRPHVARLSGGAPPPALAITRSDSEVSVSWPVTADRFLLEESADLAGATSWSPVAQPVIEDGPAFKVTAPLAGAHRFFRLTRE